MAEENLVSDGSIVREDVYYALRRAYDPLYAVNILEMGLIERVTIADGEVTVKLLKPYPDARSCNDLMQNVTRAIEQVAGVVTCVVSFIATPLWDPTMMSPALRNMFGLNDEDRHKKRYYQE